jgi:hypothetical protein
MDGRLALAVVTAVALAGCGMATFGGSASENPVDTLTPVPVASDDSRPNTPADTSVGDEPAWLSNGHIDVGLLGQTHEAFLAGRSYDGN